MKNNIMETFKNIFGYLAGYLTDLFNPQTPSYKTSLTATILFALIALLSGEKYVLFWLTIICCVFFGVLAAKQYGLGKRS